MASTWNPQYPSNASDSYLPDTLVAGSNLPTITDGTYSLIAGQNLARGAVLGKITTSGFLTLSLNASSDGSQVAFAILAEANNAVSTQICAVYTAGEFNQNALVFGTGQTVANTKDALRDGGIFLKTFVSR